MADAELRIWWLEPGEEALSVDAMPGATFKFVCAYGADERLHVVCGGAGFLEHRDLARAFAGTGQQVVVVGGGFGGPRFPGVSQAYGPPPSAFLAALGASEGPPPPPSWAREALELLGWVPGWSVEDLLQAAERCADWRVGASAHELGLTLELYDEQGRHREGLLTAAELMEMALHRQTSPSTDP